MRQPLQMTSGEEYRRDREIIFIQLQVMDVLSGADYVKITNGLMNY